MDIVPSLAFFAGIAISITISVVLMRKASNRFIINVILYIISVAFQLVVLLLLPSLAFTYLQNMMDVDTVEFYAAPLTLFFPIVAILAFMVSDGIMVTKRLWKS
ncbi:hypothetical protein DSM100688_0001 [Bifidobacterium ramosum]|uniref:Uncharacterized protein n=1 Tax=Bifidobacterium ramosum TaxID=1798158 RepID=A0A6L4X365_9BIFI|nr:hypothetical protein [Bifidobacterium ramosum]KAB8288923.1 hypothetical protein DSM100688_0001 [Bifidobacterium ramosum]NEG70641.1 hypothetical protein [Bifidobacterium ramosum]